MCFTGAVSTKWLMLAHVNKMVDAYSCALQVLCQRLVRAACVRKQVEDLKDDFAKKFGQKGGGFNTDSYQGLNVSCPT